MKIKEELLKFDMTNIFYGISEVYGINHYADFCKYFRASSISTNRLCKPTGIS